MTVGSRASAQRLVHETLLGDALDHSRLAAFVTDAGGAYVAVNEAACLLVGYSRDELIGLRATSLSARPAEKVRGTLEQIQRDRFLVGTAHLAARDGSLVEIDYWASVTTVGGIDFLLAVTEPSDLARRTAPDEVAKSSS